MGLTGAASLLVWFAMVSTSPLPVEAGVYRVELTFEAAGVRASDTRLNPLPTPDPPADPVQGRIVFIFDPHILSATKEDSLVLPASSISLVIDGHVYANDRVVLEVYFKGRVVSRCRVRGGSYVAPAVGIEAADPAPNGFLFDTGPVSDAGSLIGLFSAGFGSFIYSSARFPAEGTGPGEFSYFAGEVSGAFAADKSVQGSSSTWGSVKELFGTRP